ncbi:TIGR01777 family oxidoreductase [Salimicrobium album]|uniref:TIGR01777 family protein n=1 Tax=Salimicrobium album TaxID=50717 RepID=A0A1H3HL57_9BACI|nr:TIGR01777 family oxidoreductase [Salimicrobium album]SDY16120.1 hypothetical protein SAMN04488081_2257 [Salimicrobium album]
MNIVIAGGTGFVGQHLTEHFTSKGDHVSILTRHPENHEDGENVRYVGWLKEEYAPENQLQNVDAIINLAGASLAGGRWTPERKQLIRQSRIDATNGVLSLIENLDKTPDVLVNGSAVGFYGTSVYKSFTENTEEPGNGFLASVTKDWEATASQAKLKGVRTVYARFGLILGTEGVLPLMKLPYKYFVGGRLGNGEQWMSWVHIDDVVGAIDEAVHNSSIENALNVTAPTPKRNEDFLRTLGEVLERPHWCHVPAVVISKTLGEMSTLVLNGQAVYPQKLKSHDYQFHYSDVHGALHSILKK